MLKSADVVIERRPRAEIGRDIVGNTDQAVGLAARAIAAAGPAAAHRRPDEAGAGPAQRDRDAGLRGARHHADGARQGAEGGAEGDVITVLNEQSKRTVQGVVAGPGRVVISTGAPRLAANLPPSRTASNTDRTEDKLRRDADIEF